MDNATDVVSPNGVIPNPFAFPFSKVQPTQLNGGTVKIVDSRTFAISTEIAAAEVTVEPGAIRYVDLFSYKIIDVIDLKMHDFQRASCKMTRRIIY